MIAGTAPSGTAAQRSRFVLGASLMHREDVTALPRAADQTPAKKIANQLFYNRSSRAGKFFGYSGLGYGGKKEGFNTFINWEQFTPPIYVVPPSTPRVTVYLVNETGEEEELHAGITEIASVPVPSRAAIPKRRIQGNGTDAVAIFWSPYTDEYWEFHRFGFFRHGPLAGKPKAGAWGYHSNFSQWNGVGTAEARGGISASKMCNAIHAISLSDLVRVLRGGEIGHAIGMTCAVRTGKVAPAVGFDSGTNKFEFLEDGTTPNPAFGAVDSVPEGSWFCFPATSRPQEFGITDLFGVAFFEAARKYGIPLYDGSANPAFQIADARALFSPYCDTRVNPFHGSPQFDGYVNGGSTEAQRAPWVDSSLPAFPGALNGVGGALWNMPWGELELLEPRSG